MGDCSHKIGGLPYSPDLELSTISLDAAATKMTRWDHPVNLPQTSKQAYRDKNPDTGAELDAQAAKFQLIPKKKIRYLSAASDCSWVVRIRRLAFHVAHLPSDGVPRERCFWPRSAQQFQR